MTTYQVQVRHHQAWWSEKIFSTVSEALEYATEVSREFGWPAKVVEVL